MTAGVAALTTGSVDLVAVATAGLVTAGVAALTTGSVGLVAVAGLATGSVSLVGAAAAAAVAASNAFAAGGSILFNTLIKFWVAVLNSASELEPTLVEPGLVSAITFLSISCGNSVIYCCACEALYLAFFFVLSSVASCLAYVIYLLITVK